jgi:hypothetical protein
MIMYPSKSISVIPQIGSKAATIRRRADVFTERLYRAEVRRTRGVRKNSAEKRGRAERWRSGLTRQS